MDSEFCCRSFHIWSDSIIRLQLGIADMLFLHLVFGTSFYRSFYIIQLPKWLFWVITTVIADIFLYVYTLTYLEETSVNNYRLKEYVMASCFFYHQILANICNSVSNRNVDCVTQYNYKTKAVPLKQA